MINLKGVSKSYQKFKAVDELSLDVQAGEIFGFIGPNGAGKTTTIKMMVGLLEQDEGSISLNGKDVRRESYESKQQFSFVPDNPEVFPKLTGLAYLNFLADVYGLTTEARARRIERYAQIFEMSENLRDLISSYSHGMRQKIILIGALIHEPKILILDEPMVGLDPKSAFRLKELMRERCDQGNCVFFSTHVLEVAEKLCDRIGIINHGKLVAYGTLDEIKRQAREQGSLETIFLELTE